MKPQNLHRRSPNTWSVQDPAAHGRQVRAMFARIAGVYDFMNHFLSFNLDRRWRKRLAQHLDGDVWEVLDLCAGTGDLVLACRRAGKGRAFLATDFCPEMLRRVRGKPGGERVYLAAGDALELPLANWSVDAVVVGFGVRNFADIPRGLAEIARVLRPAGQVLVLDFFRNDPLAAGQERGPVPAVRCG